jgi:hypothetical protein
MSARHRTRPVAKGRPHAIARAAFLGLALAAALGFALASPGNAQPAPGDCMLSAAPPAECTTVDESRPVPAVECEVLGAVRRAAIARAWM